MSGQNFNELVECYGKKVFNLAYRLTGNRQDAGDIAQETFLQVHRGLSDFKGNSNIYIWIYRIAVNISIRSRKNRDRAYIDSLDEKIEMFKDEIPDEVRKFETDPEKKYLYDELLREIRRECYYFMTFRLTDEQRVVYSLRVILGFSLDDVSGILQVDKNTAKACLQRARANLKSYFSSRCQWTDGEVTCSCRSRIGFAVSYAPDVIRRLLNTPQDTRTEKLVSSSIKKIKNIDEIYRNLPMEDYKSELLLRYLKGA